jgi:hypothetical protein
LAASVLRRRSASSLGSTGLRRKSLAPRSSAFSLVSAPEHRIGAHRRQHLEAGDGRHVEVEQHHVGQLAQQHRHGVGRIGG